MKKKLIIVSILSAMIVSSVPFPLHPAEAADEVELRIPDTVISKTNLNGFPSDIDENIATPDSAWYRAVDTTLSTYLNGTLTNPSRELKSGSGIQNVKFYLRKSSTLGEFPTATMTVYENNNGTKTTLVTQTVTLTDTATVYTLSFDAASLTNKTGANIEWEVTGTVTSGGKAANKRAVEIGTVNFNATLFTPPFGAPDNLHVSDSMQQMLFLHWKSVTDAVSYQVYRDNTLVYSGPLLKFSDTGLTANTSYTYSVYAYNGSIFSPASTITASTTGEGWSKVSAGFHHTVAVKNDGTLWSWGRNQSGQLGLGDITDRTSPVQIGTSNTWTNVSAGSEFTVALKADGTLWSWGGNANGELGIGNRTNALSPVQIGNASDWKTFYAGYYHVIAVKDNGTLWSWGDNLHGQLGIGDTTGTDRTSPVQIGTSNKWTEITVGDSHAIAITSDGSKWGWGRNDYSQLGIGAYYDTKMYSPFLIAENSNIRKVGAADGDSYYIRNDNTLWGWGENQSSTISTSLGKANFPAQLGSDTTWSYAGGGQYFFLGLKENGTLWTRGRNIEGQLGLGDQTTRNTHVQLGTGTNWIKADGGGRHSVAIKTDGTLWSWGDNTYGQLGHSNLSRKSSPVQVMILSPFGTPPNFKMTEKTKSSISLSWDAVTNGTRYDLFRDDILIASGSATSFTDTGLSLYTSYTYKVTAFDGTTTSAPALLTATTLNEGWLSISAGAYHSLGIKTDGTLWTWGYNNHGQLGLGDTTNRLIPIQLGTDSDWIEIKSGLFHSAALKKNGTLWTWGRNDFGQLGLGDNITRTSPVQIGTSADWTKIATGQNHLLALKTNGTLWSWGNNTYGQLGLGDTTHRTSPVQIGTDTNWSRQLEAGFGHSMALKTSGTLWVFGRNDYGQLGLGDANNYSSPVSVGIEANWKTISSGDYHNLATKTDGTLWTWGYNNHGQLGQGDFVSRNTPIQLGTETTWKKIVGGYYFSLALKTNDTFWSWGYNSNGQLGLGDLLRRSSPRQIGIKTDWDSFSAGGYHVLALKKNYKLWVFGRSNFGQLGLNILTDKAVPTPIESDQTPPSEVMNLSETHTDSSVTLTWTNPSDADFTYIRLYRDDTLLQNNATFTTFSDTTAVADTTYMYKVTTVDEAGNESAGTSLSVSIPSVSAGSLAIAAPNATSDFGEIVISHAVQEAYTDLNHLTVSDTRTTSEGWHLSVNASLFTQTNATNGFAAKTFVPNSLQLTAIQSITQTDGSSVLPRSLLTENTFIDNGTVTLVSANPGEGMGTFEISFPANALKLTVDTRESLIDSSAVSTLYESVLTWNLSTGP